jgi:hypothetical protein
LTEAGSADHSVHDLFRGGVSFPLGVWFDYEWFAS